MVFEVHIINEVHVKAPLAAKLVKLVTLANGKHLLKKYESNIANY